MDCIVRILRGALKAAIPAMLLIRLFGSAMAGEASPWPSPALTAPARPLERLTTANSSTADRLAEMPLAETPHPASRTSDADSAPTAAEPKASPLATTETNRERSVQLEQIAQQADRQTRHGFDLAGRGAYFAARAELLGALRLVAEGLDAERKSDIHGRALAAALTAMKEAENFLPRGAQSKTDSDLPGIIAVHTTPVLKNETEKIAPLTALQQYLTYAQEQFAAAAGREVAGSMALHALGKLHAALAQKKTAPIAASESKAMVFYQAALLVYPKNYMAANDLGVLLAQCGRWEDAQATLEHSLKLCPQPTGWQNLAAVYRQLGQAERADRAARQATLLAQREFARQPSSVGKQVQWVDRQTFAQTSLSAPNSPVVAALPPVAKPQAASGMPVMRPQAAYAPANVQPQSIEANWPASTPAAAQRRAWGATAYER